MKGGKTCLIYMHRTEKRRDLPRQNDHP